MKNSSSIDTVESFQGNAFFKELKAEVSQFMNKEGLSVKTPGALCFKAAVLFLVWGVLFFFYLKFGQVHWGYGVLFSVLWSLVMISIQMSVMHDASHGATSDSQTLNFLLTLPISFLGGSALLWKKQHCQAHHSFTNVHERDHDVNTNGLLRLHPSQPWKEHYKNQEYYAWLLYPLFVLSWVWWGDFRDIIYNTYSMTKPQLKKALVETVIIKIWHTFLFLVLPAILFNSVLLAVVCYLISFAILGFVMVVVFQLAHISNIQKLPASMADISEDWAVRQLLTTANFATGNRFLTWYVGGLNYQIEHHIFPTMSHVNYPKIQHIVKEFCAKKKVPYLVFPTLGSTVRSHQNHLRKLASEYSPVSSPAASWQAT